MEDPSLQVRYDNELGQTIIGAMGELHIEVIRDRFQRDYGLNVFVGSLQVYRSFVCSIIKKQKMDFRII